MPETVARGVLRRLTGLHPAAIMLARAIAVLGTDVGLGEAAQLAGLGGEAAANAMDRLAAAGLLRPETPLRFVHPLVREAIYHDLPAGTRRHQHRRAAEVLDAAAAPELVAAHLLECEPVGDQQSVSVLVRCGARAMARGAPETAVRYFSRALTEGPADFVPVLLELGIAEARLGRSEAVQHLRSALALPKTVSAACTATRELGVALAARGQLDEALDTLENGVTALSARDREQGLLLLGELCAIGQLYPAWTPRITARVREVAPALTGRTAGERLVLAGYAHLRSNQGTAPDELAELAQRALQDGRLLAEQTGDSAAVYLLIYVLHRAERDDLADRWLEAALVDTRARGSVFGTTIGQAVRGQLRWLRGDLADAEADARVSIDAQLEAGWNSVLPLAVHVLAECLLERGEPAAAVRLFGDLGLTGGLPELTMYRWMQATRGRALVAAGDVDAGLADLMDCECENMGTQSGLGLLWRTDVAQVLHARGEHDGARQLAAEQLALAQQFSVPRIQGVAQRTMGHVAESAAQARQWLTMSVETLGGSSARLEHARALVELGACIRRAGTPTAAREPLREGYELARRCGSAVLVAQAASELAAAGVRLRRPALSGVDALTPSERRVAEMAATGMTNPEIAQALFLTRKTIEMHLGRAYRKLSVSGRSELTGLFGK
ncbi:MAG: hypothetical protein QOH89_122 [Pseudonocardiales bacterium]|nr:hypothetical protein [Pseudonocardiales bacterium]